jgi:molybdopterin/thiamine biosynthesis adenylyltransferase
MSADLPPLTEKERATYEWQMWVADFGEEGQRALKGASVLISRVGGVGGTAAYYLAAAGIGRLVLAHAGNVRTSDLNRQLLMTHEGLGQSRVESARRRLLELNPRLQIEAVEENVSEANVARLVSSVDLIVDAAPRFGERFLLNREAVRQRKPMVDPAMFEFELRLTSIVPGRTPCLACLYPADPPAWQREFPVFGAVAGAVGSLAAMEAIKLLAKVGEPLLGQMLIGSLRDMRFQTVKVQRNPACAVCAETVG